MTVRTFDFGHHNINGDGRPTNQWTNRDRILVTTETNNPGKRNPPVGHEFNTWLPDVNASLAVCVTRASGFLNGIGGKAPGVVRFHGTGKNEGYPFATPARHAAFRDINLYGHPATVIVTHMLNHGDHQAQRDAVWFDVEWPKVVALVQATQARGRLVLLGGDFNRARLPKLAGLREITGPGTDHLLVSRGLIKGDDLTIGPETGRSGNVHHHSQTAHLSIEEKTA